jgi:cobaltochelatase CobS
MATIQEQIKRYEDMLATTTDDVVRKQLQAEINKLQLQQSASSGDSVSSALLQLKEVLEAAKKTPSGAVGIDKSQAEKIVKDALSTTKIGMSNLDDTLRAYLLSQVKVQLQLKTPTFSAPGGTIAQTDYERPLFQKILSDLVSMNNVYLFGGAGTGKTYIAKQIADFMDWQYVELNCNQMTSSLDILGGQTIEGYQVGALEMAWGNLDSKGNPSGKKGAVLCLDELPKIDPNTAGILNAALANVKNYSGGFPPELKNGRNQMIRKGNLLIIATGNVKLNEMSTEYEANFKQDLSLQDRFVGSTYEVFADYRNEAYNEKLMKNFLFIWIPLIKLREKILEMKWTGQAFVSIRIMLALRDTYVTYRGIVDGTIVPEPGSKDMIKKISDPKTLKQGLDSFLNLFKQDQIDQLKTTMGYDNFIRTIEVKNKLPLDQLNTSEEEKEAKQLVERYEQMIAQKTI